MITQTELKDTFKYNPETGQMLWKNPKRPSYIGKEAGSFNNETGYRTLTINGKTYLTHRMVWLYVKGSLPPMIDHINSNKLDNRINNLRPCTQKENSRNKATIGKLGYKGVSKGYKTWKYAAKICVNGEVKHLGLYSTAREAAQIYDVAAVKYFGEFAMTNRAMGMFS